MNGEPVSSWVPYAVRRGESGELLVDWCGLLPRLFEEPFFDQTVWRTLRESGSRRTTSVRELETGVYSRSTSPGFIFHVSRCGSTLLCQMLAAVARFVVLAEPSVIEEALREESDPESRVRLLRNVIAALTSRDEDQHTFIKFAARTILDHQALDRAFPAAPWVFLYRDPLEVVVSLVGRNSEQLPPGIARSGALDADAATVARMRPAEYWARVVGMEMEAALTASNMRRIRFVNYCQLPEAGWREVLHTFGISASPTDIEAMQAAATRSAKRPSVNFVSDSHSKRAAATAEIRDVVDDYVRPQYERIESKRLAQK